MNIGVDAASLGMGGAVVASTKDINSGYWNPAGLVNLQDSAVALMYSNYFANIANYNYIAFAMPLDNRTAIGISIIRFGVDDILDTTKLIDQQGNINYDRINLFSAADYGFTFSYARKLPISGLNYGVNAKIIRRIIGDFASSWGFGLDLGIQFKSKNWEFGIMMMIDCKIFKMQFQEKIKKNQNPMKSLYLNYKLVLQKPLCLTTIIP